MSANGTPASFKRPGVEPLTTDQYDAYDDRMAELRGEGRDMARYVLASPPAVCLTCREEHPSWPAGRCLRCHPTVLWRFLELTDAVAERHRDERYGFLQKLGIGIRRDRVRVPPQRRVRA